MAREDAPPEERDQTLYVSSIIDCPACETEIDWVFRAPPGISETEDIVDSIVDDVACPYCTHLFTATWEGWTIHDDAG